MSSPVIAVSEDDGVEECYEKMEQYQIRRIPVLDASGKISGIVSQADIALNSGMRETAEMW
jgi:CBS domain-containing protein